jgi:hypothetical protein
VRVMAALNFGWCSKEMVQAVIDIRDRHEQLRPLEALYFGVIKGENARWLIPQEIGIDQKRQAIALYCFRRVKGGDRSENYFVGEAGRVSFRGLASK